MRRIRFRLLHLFILMTLFCIFIPSYLAYKNYDHRRKVERLEVVTKLLDDEMKEFLSIADGHRSTKLPTDLQQLIQMKAQVVKKNEYVKSLQLEAAHLSIELNP